MWCVAKSTTLRSKPSHASRLGGNFGAVIITVFFSRAENEVAERRMWCVAKTTTYATRG
jgi:hypothetical protein